MLWPSPKGSLPSCLLHGGSYTYYGSNPIPTDEGGTNLYWSLGEPILVTALTYIGCSDDLYRFTQRPI